MKQVGNVWNAPECELTYGQRAGRVAGGVDASSLKRNCLCGGAHSRSCNIAMEGKIVKRNVFQSAQTPSHCFHSATRCDFRDGTCVSLMIATGIPRRSVPAAANGVVHGSSHSLHVDKLQYVL